MELVDAALPNEEDLTQNIEEIAEKPFRPDLAAGVGDPPHCDKGVRSTKGRILPLVKQAT